jgi:hypothetical protein
VGSPTIDVLTVLSAKDARPSISIGRISLPEDDGSVFENVRWLWQCAHRFLAPNSWELVGLCDQYSLYIAPVKKSFHMSRLKRKMVIFSYATAEKEDAFG